MKLASETFSRRLQRRLRENTAAMQILRKELCLDEALISRFHIGLSEPYPKPSGGDGSAPLHRDLLVAPLCGHDGQFYGRYSYIAVDGVSVDNRLGGTPTWSPGAAETYYSRKPRAGDALFICGSLADLWALASLITDHALQHAILLVCSTKGSSEWPDSWTDPDFWRPWKAVYIGLPSGTPDAITQRPHGDQRAEDIARLGGRPVNRVWPVGAASWTALCKAGFKAEDLRNLLVKAPALEPQHSIDDRAQFQSAKAEDISSSFHKGYLYEAVRVLQQIDTANGRTECYRVVVVRSDRSLHTARTMPSPKDTPKSERVHRLIDDGSQLARLPRASTCATWSWPSIRDYIDGKCESSPLRELIANVTSHLKASVWLPAPCSYSMLSCVIVASFCQQVFDAVPLILVNGPRGSGKTELGIAMAELGANSPPPIGMVSAATIARLIDSTRGFVVIDDLEKVMAKRNGELQISELAQTLKLSYKKESAWKWWTDSTNMQVERLNFFGIKLINNTSGVDEILGSRMLTVSTRPMPSGQQLSREARLSAEERSALRDQLHTWAFLNVQKIVRTYTEIFPNRSSRAEEISAPIRVIARLSEDAAVQADVEQALKLNSAPSEAPSSSELMEDAVEVIICKAITEDRHLRTTLTVMEVQMRMRLLGGKNFGKHNVTDVADIESAEWIGRQFRHVFAKVGSEPQRLQMHAHGTRAWVLQEVWLDRAVRSANVISTELSRNEDPRAFCRDCIACDYADFCSMKSRKALAFSAGAEKGPSARRPQSAEKSSDTGAADFH